MLSVFHLFLPILVLSALVARAQAADDTEFRNSGEVRFRYFNDLNASGRDASEQKADSALRFKFNIAARKGENLQAYLSVINNTRFGDQNSINGDNSTVNTPVTGAPPSNSNTSTNNLLLVSRAWGLWKANESLSFRVGRFGIAVADGAVFSENDWQVAPTAHEGLEAAIDTDVAKLSAYFTKTNELSVAPASQSGAPSSDPERNLYLVTADIKNLPDALKTANLHFAFVTRDRTDAPSPPSGTYLNGAQSIQHLGLTLGGDISGFIYKATGAYQSGIFSKTDTVEQKLRATMVDALVGYANTELANLRLTASFHSDSGNGPDFVAASSGQFERYQTFYYERHDYAGLMDLVEWGNLTYWSVEGSFFPSEDFELGARTYLFSQTRPGDPDGVRVGDRFSSLGTNTSGDRNIGQEIDGYGTKFYEGGFKVSARISAFFPSDYFRNLAVPRDKTFYQAMFQGAFEF